MGQGLGWPASSGPRTRLARWPHLRAQLLVLLLERLEHQLVLAHESPALLRVRPQPVVLALDVLELGLYVLLVPREALIVMA